LFTNGCSFWVSTGMPASCRVAVDGVRSLYALRQREEIITMCFAVLSWNVRKFKGGTDPRADRVADLINSFIPVPDIIVIFEVENSHGVFRFAEHFFPDYTCFITEGQNSQEIALIINRSSFDFVTVTQKYKFKIGNPNLRPGVLATLTQGDVHTNILFLHVASMTLADGFGDRFEILNHALSLNKKIQQLAEDSGEQARLIIAGDLNTMGLQFPSKKIKSHRVLTGEQEIAGLDHLAARAHRGGFQGMSRAPKEHDLTFSNSNGSQKGDLDHVLVSSGLELEQLGNLPSGDLFAVRVKGWQQLYGANRKDFVDNVSDHCALYFRVK
jgi:endonuclease/exonuclease/phosphatase family metal-dependent hydrolase